MTIDIDTAPGPDLTARLQVAGLALAEQAAVLILRDFGDGSLLEWRAIREFLHIADDGALYVWWHQLGAALDEGRNFGYLSSSAAGALELAVGLATGRPVTRLGDILCQFDRNNAEVVHRAFACPLRQGDADSEPARGRSRGVQVGDHNIQTNTFN